MQRPSALIMKPPSRGGSDGDKCGCRSRLPFAPLRVSLLEGDPMPVNILMPALSPTMEKGNLAKWVKKEGDKVKAGDVIAEIETDKATMEVEAVDEGVLAKIVVPEGTQDVPVNQLIAVLAGEGEDPKTVAAAGEGAAPRSLGTPASQAPQDEGPRKSTPTSPHPEEARSAVSKGEGG